MNTLRRDSFGDLVLASAPRHRWSLSSVASRASSRRSRASSSDASSTCSLQSERQAACFQVALGNDCAFHLFMTWVAVKRNESVHISPEQKRQCPLLHCCETFANHELMLLHLYTCQHRSSGEFWCFNCGRVEQWNDSKSKRCLGHPSRRRKIMSMAKSFFTSLGHKSKNRSVVNLHPAVLDEEPPSYDSVVAPAEAELPSNEIHEADSCEISAAIAFEDRTHYTLESFDYLSCFGPMPNAQPPQALQPEIEQTHRDMEDSFIDWNQCSEGPVQSAQVHTSRDTVRALERPVLQLETQGLEYRKPRSIPRNRHLAPSSSIRSTASNHSTASSNISPMSAWSGCWSMTSGFTSALSTPADDVTKLADLLTVPHNDSCSRISEQMGDLDNMAVAGILPVELPGDEPISAVCLGAEPMAIDSGSSDTPLSGQISTIFSDEVEMAAPSNPTDTCGSSSRTKGLHKHQHVDSQTLASLTRNTVTSHVKNSMNQLRNHQSLLIRNFGGMSAKHVTEAGLMTLSNLLDGHHESSAIMLLCFLHVIYSFSLLVHQENAVQMSGDFFDEALSYALWIAEEDRQAYTEVVKLLWEPSGLMECARLRTHRQSKYASVDRKGKERVGNLNRLNLDADPLIMAAMSFLDDIELATLDEGRDNTLSDVEPSRELVRGQSWSDGAAYHFETSPGSLLWPLIRKYGEIPKLEATIKRQLELLNKESSFSPRRLELGLLRAGKMRLGATDYLDGYSALVHDLILPLYQCETSYEPGIDPRMRYHRLSLQLLMSLMTQPPKPSTDDTAAGRAFDNNMALLGSDGPIMGDSDETMLELLRAPVLAVNVDSDADASAAISSTATSGTWTAKTVHVASPAHEVPGKKVVASIHCDECDYRPSGDPQWFAGSLARHRKRQHGYGKEAIYKCPYPGCTSQFKSRPDNLRQHQIDKGHFVDAEEVNSRTPSKRKKLT